MPDDGDRFTALAQPPHSLDAEQQVLGALMVDGSALDRVEAMVGAADFYASGHQLIFEHARALSLAGKPTDPVSVAEALSEVGKLEYVGGLRALADMHQAVASVRGVERFAAVVRDRSIKRRLVAFAGDVAQAAFARDGRSADELVDEAQRGAGAIADASTRDNDVIPIGSLFAAVADKIEHRMLNRGDLLGLPTGIGDLDAKTLGLQSGELIIVAGRPSMGKTTLAMQFATEAAKLKRPALVFSLEMKPHALAESMIANVGHVDAWRMRTGDMTTDDWSAFSATIGRAHELPIYIDGNARMTVERITSRARQVKRKHGLGIIVIDYLQLLEGGGEDNRNEQVGAMSRGLKLLAGELEVPVVVLSQLNRSCEARVNKRPMMSDLRDSGAIEADADVIMFVYRDEVYNHHDDGLKAKAELIIAKQREGEPGTVYAAFIGHHKRFANTEWRPAHRAPVKRAARGMEDE